MHRFEIKINQRIVKDPKFIDENQEGELNTFIKPLSVSRAFTKGIDYFCEIFFFYGMLMAISVYEIRKSHISSEK